MTEAQIEAAKTAKEDPSVAFQKQHRHGAVPTEVQCASKVWHQLHAADAPLTLSPGPLSRAPYIDKARKQRTEVHTLDGPPSNSNAGGNGKGHDKPTLTVIQKGGSSKTDLRSLPSGPPEKKERPEREAPEITPGVLEPGSVDADRVMPPSLAALSTRLNLQPEAAAPGPSITFDGLDFANWGAGHPPDTNGDVGPTYYIQTINTSIGIYRKTDGARVAAFTFNTFMSQGHFGNLCDTNNFGDPVVLYDSFEDRWIITDFAFRLDGSGNVINPPGSLQCFAVSMNSDPVSGGWNYYSINTAGGLGDYPKFGIWPDGLYMSTNMFNYASGGGFQNSRLYAFNKAQMYAGNPTVQVVSFDLPSDQFTVLPANARLQSGTPPAGSPNYFASVWVFLNAIEIWKFHVDWDNPPLSTVTGPFDSLMTFWWEQYGRLVGTSTVTTAPTPANANDTLYPRLMVQNQYSNIGGVESLWDTHTVGAGNPISNLTSAQSAVRYYQVNVTGGLVAANTLQSFTYSPDTATFRYMPSTAVDRSGNMAIGYSTSNASTNPALKYAGRLAGDAANSISLTEQTLFQGTGSQSGNCGSGTCVRWGDYSAMSLDPDGCTFWYTNEYYGINGLNHQTKIGAFTFAANCTPVSGQAGSLAGTVTASAGGSPISGATVSFGSRVTTTGGTGSYSFPNVPIGTYATVTVTYPGYNTATASNVLITNGGMTIQNFALDQARISDCLVDDSQTEFTAGDKTNVDVTTNPGHVLLAHPDQIDQQNATISNSGFGFSNTSWAGQTFTAAVTAPVIKADLYLFCSGCSGANPNITVSIRATAGTPPVPTGADLATATIAGFNDAAAGGYHTATFSSPMTMVSGTRYAIIFRLVAARTGAQAYVVSTANPYANGQRVSSGNSGGTWTADTTSGGRDLGFKIYYNLGYQPVGTLVSSVKDSNPAAGYTPTWGSLGWSSFAPIGTALKFQVAASPNRLGPFTFVGPDGTSATFFTIGPAPLSQFNGNRYLKYAATLTSSDPSVTPSLDGVSICFSDHAPPQMFVAPSSGTYGGNAVLTATMTSGGIAVPSELVTFKVDGESTPIGTATTDASGVATTTVDLGNRNAVSHTINASFGGDSSYGPSTGSGTLTINQKPITVTAVSDSKPYDGTTLSAGVPTFMPALVGTDTASFTQTFDSKNAGSRSLVPSGSVNDGNSGNNYNVTFVNVSGSISEKGLTGSVTADNKVYDGTDAATILTRTVSGVVGPDIVAYSGGTATFNDKNAGTGKAVHATGLSLTGADAGNYSVNATADTTADISRRPISVTADSGQTKVYGSADPAFTYSVTDGSLVTGDGFTGALGRVAGENFGSYALTQGSLTAGGNYNLTFVPANFAITRLAITVSAVADTKVYDGNTSSSASPSIAPALIGSDTSGFTQTFDTKIAGSGKTLTATGSVNDGNGGNNYSVAFAPNNAGAIGQRPITVSANAAQGKVYGTADPALTYSITLGSLVAGDSLSGALTRAAGEDFGDYAISQGSLTAGGNYDLTFVGANFHVSKASALHINVTGYTGVYDGLAHTGSGTVVGVHNEDLSSLLSFAPGVKDVPGGTNAWTFAGNLDYLPASGSVDIVITRAPLTVTANNVARLYGYPNPALTARYSGFVNGETLATSGVSGTPNLSTTATQFSAAGPYPIASSLGTLAANNYSFVFVNGTLTVYESGLIGLDSASIGSNKAVVDSFDSGTGTPGTSAPVFSNGAIMVTGAKVSGNLVSTGGNITLQSGTVLTGNVLAGGTVTNRGTVTGSITQGQLADALVAPAVPSCGAFTVNPSITGGAFAYSNGDLSVSGNNTVTIAPGSYCFHNVTLGGQAHVQVGGAVSITVSGVLNAAGGSFTNATHVPANLQIASSFSGPAGVTIGGGPSAYLTVYAPATDVAITGNASFFGAVLGKTLTIGGNPDVHYDTALPNVWGVYFGF